MRFVTLALVALLALVHAELWFGKGGVPRMVELQGKLDAQQADQRGGAAAQRAARGRGERPQGGPRDGRGEGPLRARHDQARRDLRPALARRGVERLSGWLARRRRCSPRAFAVWGSPVTWLEIVAFALADRDGRLQHPRQSARLAAGDRQLAAVLRCCSGTAGSTATPALQIFFARRRRLGLVAVAARHRRPTGRRCGCAARRARALDRARRARDRLAGDRRSSCAASPTPTCPGGMPSRPPRASSASGCSAASTSRTGRSGSPSTSSASALFAYKGLWLTVLLYAVFVAMAVVGWRAWQRRARGDAEPAA